MSPTYAKKKIKKKYKHEKNEKKKKRKRNSELVQLESRAQSKGNLMPSALS